MNIVRRILPCSALALIVMALGLSTALAAGANCGRFFKLPMRGPLGGE